MKKKKGISSTKVVYEHGKTKMIYKYKMQTQQKNNGFSLLMLFPDKLILQLTERSKSQLQKPLFMNLQ